MSDFRIDRRKHPRVPVAIRTVYDDELDPDETDALMSNLSLGGCFVRTTNPPPAGTIIKLRFRLPNRTNDIEALGEVRWVEERKEKSGMGIKFLRIREEDLVELKKFIEKKLMSALFSQLET